MKVVDESLLAPTLHDNVVDVRLNVTPDLPATAFLHSPLKGSACILETKGHASIIEAPYRRDKHRILFILDRHLDLVITREGVEEGQQVTPYRGVHDLIDVRQRERILRSGFVEIRDVDAHPHSPIWFWTTTGFASHMGSPLPRSP
jgi:hypothetical protein